MTKKEGIFMSQPISVSVQMDAASFHDFAAFDLLRHHKAWHRHLAVSYTHLFRQFFTVQPVSGIADFKGLKLRVSSTMPFMTGSLDTRSFRPLKSAMPETGLTVKK